MPTNKPDMTFVSPQEDTTDQKNMLQEAHQQMTEAMHIDGGNRSKAPLSQEELDRYVELSKGYLGGPNIPFEIQLLAFDKHAEEPSGITIADTLGLTVVEFMREVIPLKDRKEEFGVAKGVEDPEALLEIKQRAVMVYTRCALEVAESEVQEEVGRRMAYFPAPAGAKLGKNGYIHLFPGYPDSPAGAYRGDGAAFDSLECIEFIGKHFPDVEDEIMKALLGDE
jgi:hypothetical protein